MKASTIAYLLLAEVVLAAPANEKRQAMSALGAIGNTGYGRVGAAGKAAKPTEEVSPLADTVPGAKRIKVRTGPYKAPGMERKNPFSGHYGMLESYYDMDIQKPCSDCNILRQEGGLEYEDGSNANINTGMWLHHMVHFIAGDRRWDPVGAQAATCLPFDGMALAPAFGTKPAGGANAKRNAERFFVTGNERTPFNFFNPTSSVKSAYHLDAKDQFFYLVELMNMNMDAKNVYITMTYDVLPGALPAGWSEVKTVFLDADSCGTSEVASPAGKTSFSIPLASKPMKPWTPNITGRIVDSMGHLHDGGIEIDVNAGEGLFCKSIAVYSKKPEYVFRDTGMTNKNKDKVAKDHISNMDGCGMEDIKTITEVKKNQAWSVTGRYDYSKKTPNLEANKPSEVMAIAIVLVAVEAGKYNKYPGA